MAIEQLRPEILFIEAQLTSVYRRAQTQIDAQLAQLISDPARFSAVARLRDIRDRIDMLLRQVDVQAASWVNSELPTIYRLGTVDALAGSFSQVPTQAMSRLQLGTLRSLLEATTSVQFDVKRLLDTVSRDAALDKVLGLRDLRGTTERMTELVDGVAPSAITYANGAQVPLEHYAAMVVRTRTAVAYNSGTLDATKAGGTEFVELSDGPFCVMPGTRFDPLGEIKYLVRAMYSGPAYCLRFRTRTHTDEVTVGPHHPVLTRRGWKRAGALNEGDELIYGTRREGLPAVAVADLEQVPAVEDVFEATSALAFGRIPRSVARDLHGDGRFCEDEIEVVAPTRELLLDLNAALREKGRHGVLVISDVGLVSVPSRRHLLSLGLTVGSAGSLVSSSSTSEPLLSSFALSGKPIGFGRGPFRDVAHLAENRRYGLGVCSESFRYGGAAQLLCDVEPAEFITVNRSGGSVGAGVRAEPPGRVVARMEHGAAHFAGHSRRPLVGSVSHAVIESITVSHYEGWVYDATTTSGVFSASGVVVKNCGLDGHDELPEADGLIMTVDEAYDHILSHANCRRAFLPRPDIASIDDKGVPTLTGALSAA